MSDSAAAFPPAVSGESLNLNPLREDLSEFLDKAAQGKLFLTGAESLTAGGVSAFVAAIPGASRVFRGSFVAYSHEFKSEAIGVSRSLLANQGAIDPEVVAQMALGARAKAASFEGVAEDRFLSFATSGVAGPEPSDRKPVGLVYVAVANHLESVQVRELWLQGDREQVQSLAVQAAIELLVEQTPLISGSPHS